MVNYQVQITVDEKLSEEFESYMTTKHIEEVLDAGAFLSASFEKSAEDASRYRVVYVASDRGMLELYYKNHAETLREDFHTCFPSGVEIAREEWSVVKQFA